MGMGWDDAYEWMSRSVGHTRSGFCSTSSVLKLSFLYLFLGMMDQYRSVMMPIG